MSGSLWPSEAPLPLRRQMPDPQPFPIEALGEVLGDAARAIVDKVQCPVAIASLSVLGAASLAVQAHADIVIPATGQAKPSSLFLVSVAATGERKSAADSEALSPIRQREKEIRDWYDGLHQIFVNQHEAWESTRDKLKRTHKGDYPSLTAALNALGPPPSAPLLPMLTCPEPTFEGLCRLFAVGYPALGIFSDEGGQFVGGHGLNVDNRLRTAAGLSSLWDGTPIKRVRVADGSSVLPGRRAAMHLMLQPDVAKLLLSDPMLKDQGLLSRILVSAPTSTAGSRFQRMPHVKSATALRRYDAQLLDILRLQPPLAPGKANQLEPRPLALDAEASRLWATYADAVERRIADGQVFEPIRGLANKLPEHAARIAAVLELVESINSPFTQVDTLKRAITISEHFAAECPSGGFLIL